MKIPKDAAMGTIVLAIALTVAILAILASLFIAVQIAEAAEAKRSTVLCDGCKGTGPQKEKQVDGGLSVFQVTCLTTDANTFPDGIDLEARDSSTHTWASVQAFVTAVEDGRQTNTFAFAEASFARIVITHAAGTHSCYATLASIGK